MAKDRSFASCFLIAMGVAALLIAILLASMDWIKKTLRIDQPDSKVGRKIDEHIPQAEAVHQFARAKEALQVFEMRNIKDAVAMFYLQYDRPPNGLEEMIRLRTIDAGALRDLWGHVYLFIPYEREIFLVSGGADRIRNTEDDKIVRLINPGLEIPEEERSQLAQIVSEFVMKGKVEVPPSKDSSEADKQSDSRE